MYNLIHIETVKSTMHNARELAFTGQDIIVQADIQTEGYGRRGRIWKSDKGNLYMTLVTEPLDAKAVFAVALALRFAIAKYVGDNVSCKWPNDILVDGLKVGGTIIEQEEGRTLIGIGVNIKHHPGDGVRYPATSVSSYNSSVNIDEMRDAIYEQFLYWKDAFKNKGFDYIRAEWEKYSYRQGKEITILVSDDTYVTGKFLGLDSSGAILVENEGVPRKYFAGDFEWQVEDK